VTLRHKGHKDEEDHEGSLGIFVFFVGFVPERDWLLVVRSDVDTIRRLPIT
jgi:hypothetical protein